MKTLARSVALAGAFFIPIVASAASIIGGVGSGGWFFGVGSGGAGGGFGLGCGNNTICIIASEFLYMIDYVLVPLLFAVAFIVFLYGVFVKYIYSHGEPGAVKEGHQLILWGIVGFTVMISIWGIVNIAVNTLGLANVPPPPQPLTPYQ